MLMAPSAAPERARKRARSRRATLTAWALGRDSRQHGEEEWGEQDHGHRERHEPKDELRYCPAVAATGARVTQQDEGANE
jgi:hypothetical protein